jgi:hypothetical protein
MGVMGVMGVIGCMGCIVPVLPLGIPGITPGIIDPAIAIPGGIRPGGRSTPAPGRTLAFVAGAPGTAAAAYAPVIGPLRLNAST